MVKLILNAFDTAWAKSIWLSQKGVPGKEFTKNVTLANGGSGAFSCANIGVAASSHKQQQVILLI